MKFPIAFGLLLTGIIGRFPGGPVSAATVQMFGSGSTVSVVDRRATFDIINSSYTAELGNYQEGGLSVTTGSQAWGADPPMAARLDPFHLPGGQMAASSLSPMALRSG